MICEKCKNNIPDTAKFCPTCGTKVEIAKAQQVEQKTAEKPAEKLEDLIICPKCGTSYPLTAKFCKKDGTPLQKVAPIPKEEVKPPEVKEKELKPEEVVAPITPVVTAETKVEEKPPERAPEVEKPKDVIICPKCGTPNPLTAKFCKKDGTPLKEEVRPAEPKEKEVKPKVIVEPKPTEIITETKEVEKPPEKIVEIEKQKVEAPLKEEIKPPTVEKKEIKPEISVQPRIKETVPPKEEVKREPVKRPSKTWIWLTILGLVIIIAGAGGYLYFSGQIGKKPSEVTPAPEVSKPPEPAKPEEVAKTSEPPQVPQKVEPEIEKPIPPLPKGELVKPTIHKPETPSVDITKLEREVNRSLRNRGLNDIYAEVDTSLVATLMGTTSSQEDRNRAISIARSYREIKEIRDNIQVKEVKLPPPAPKVDPAKLEGDINRALRNAGLRGITAEVSDDLQVTLKGSVGSAQEKNRAFEIAKTFKDAKRIRDVIFIVEQ